MDEHTTLIAFESDAWAVCYGYCTRSYLYTGVNVDKTNHSGTMLKFLKRFSGKKTLVFIKGKKFCVTRHGSIRQIPIDSLNVMQSKTYDFPISSLIFDYYLSNEQLESISFTCDDPEFYEWFGQGHAPARTGASAFNNQVD